jgi:hypothetical protein
MQPRVLPALVAELKRQLGTVFSLGRNANQRGTKLQRGAARHTDLYPDAREQQV